MKPKLTVRTSPQVNAERKRRHERITPVAPNTLAQIDLNAESKTFSPTLPALVFDTSVHGVGLIVSYTKELYVGARCYLQVGNSSPKKAEVRWRQDIDPKAIKIGILFLE